MRGEGQQRRGRTARCSERGRLCSTTDGGIAGQIARLVELVEAWHEGGQSAWRVGFDREDDYSTQTTDEMMQEHVRAGC